MQLIFRTHMYFDGHAFEAGGSRVSHSEQSTRIRTFGPLRFGQLVTGRRHVQLVQIRSTERGRGDLIGGQLDGCQQRASYGVNFQDLNTVIHN